MYLSNSENLARRDRLIERLRDVRIGGMIGHREIATFVGDKPHLFNSARKVLEKEAGIIFENVFGEGYKRITSDALPEIGRKARKEIANKARIAGRRLTNGAKFGNGLDRETRLRLNQELGLIGMLREIANKGV
jgi:hypothetical protein